MSELQWIPGQDQLAENAIKDVKRNGSPTNWMFVTYAETKGPNSTKLKFGGSGGGGVEELKQNLTDEIIAFALVRVTDVIDQSVTVKFVWVNWLPTRCNTMQRAKVSVHLGPAKSFFGQTHHDYTCETADELTHDIIMERVMQASGSGSKVIDKKTGQTAIKSQVVGAGTAATVKSAGKKTDEVTIDDGVGQALKQLRTGALSWVAATYHSFDRPLIVLKASGTGDVSEIVPELQDDNVCYVLVRKIEQIDQTEAVKFVYIRWVGSGIPTLQKAKLASHSGAVTQYFAPIHTTLDAPELSEVTDENVMNAVKKASGTYHNVLEGKKGKPSPSQSFVPRSTGGAPKTHGGAVQTVEAIINFEDEAGIRAAIKAVRADNDPTNWVLITYTADKSKTLKLLATGTGNLDELKSYLSDRIVAYGLYRTTSLVDASTTTKFVFCDWRGENIHRMQLAVLGTHSGAVKDIFTPYHVDILASHEDEISEDLIQEKINRASGTASYVL